MEDNAKSFPLALNSRVSIAGTESCVRDVLLGKHPAGHTPKPSVLVSPFTTLSAPPFHPVLFDRLDGSLIHRTILQMDGAAGPSGMDVASWKKLCTSFRSASDSLCDALAAVARRLATTFVDPVCLSAFTACRLIALDKRPGVRPIRIGKVCRRLIAKAVLVIVRDDVLQAVGPLQLCAGQPAGCEAAIHAMQRVFDSPETEGVLQVDATNAFNCLNRQAALRNISILCPSFARILINTYRMDSRLFIDGEYILSQEGTTQGDPLAMPMYALGVVPLIRQLAVIKVSQLWYADDASAGGSLRGLCSWWDRLVCLGPDYGYYPNAAKTCLIVKPTLLRQAKAIFHGSGVVITDSGKRIGSAIGTPAFVEGFVQEKVATWVSKMEKLSEVAVTQPQAAYAAFMHVFLHRWSYVARTIPWSPELFHPLDDPSLFACSDWSASIWFSGT